MVIIDKDRGRKVFHARFISLSYRIRGRVPRTQINRKAKNMVLITRVISAKILNGGAPKKKIEVKRLMVKILVYSAIKISAKLPALNSTLNPDTSSVSPSDKSKGVRLVSARDEINQIINKGGRMKDTDDNWLDVIETKLKAKSEIKVLSRIRAILTSYEIVWAILRIAPKSAYFELDDHPSYRRM